MFNKKELDKRIGPLKKDKGLYNLEQVEGYVIRKASENGLESSYDVMAEEMPYFKTLAYTEYAGNFYLQPLNFKLRNEQLIDAYTCNEETKILDYSDGEIIPENFDSSAIFNIFTPKILFEVIIMAAGKTAPIFLRKFKEEKIPKRPESSAAPNK